MVDRPSLNALRAFEAAARLGSMKRAAEELHVTPGAVSQKVRGLEAELGVPLFRRLPRALELTEAGASYAGVLLHAFRRIDEATKRLRNTATQKLVVSAAPVFAASWLVPRLGGFGMLHPSIALQLVTGRTLADLSGDGVDVAIRHGLGRYRGLRADPIAPVVLLPVCSPGFLASLADAAPSRPGDLLHLSLLHDAARADWPAWFAANGVHEVPAGATEGLAFDDQALLIRAAASGQGIALVTEVLARAELENGSLVRAVDVTWRRDSTYWLVCREDRATEPPIAAFRTWLLAEATNAGGA